MQQRCTVNSILLLLRNLGKFKTPYKKGWISLVDGCTPSKLYLNTDLSEKRHKYIQWLDLTFLSAGRPALLLATSSSHSIPKNIGEFHVLKSFSVSEVLLPAAFQTRRPLEELHHASNFKFWFSIPTHLSLLSYTNKAAPQYCPLSPWRSIWANHHHSISSIPSLPESITLNTHSTTNLLRLEVQKDSCFPWTCIDAIFNHRRTEAVIQTLRQPFTKVYQTSNTLQGSEVAALGHFMPTDRYQVQEKKSQNSLTENQLLYK